MFPLFFIKIYAVKNTHSAKCFFYTHKIKYIKNNLQIFRFSFKIRDIFLKICKFYFLNCKFEKSRSICTQMRKNGV